MKYLKRGDRSAVHIIRMDDETIEYEQGWFSNHAFGLSANFGVYKINLNDPLDEPICYYGGLREFFESTYEETDRGTFERIYNQAKKISEELKSLKIKLNIPIDHD